MLIGISYQACSCAVQAVALITVHQNDGSGVLPMVLIHMGNAINWMGSLNPVSVPDRAVLVTHPRLAGVIKWQSRSTLCGVSGTSGTREAEGFAKYELESSPDHPRDALRIDDHVAMIT